jgi:putative ABC transport system permease protein
MPLQRLSGIRYIYESRLESRKAIVQECFAIIGIAIGVALLFASQVSGTSLTRSVAQLTSQFVGDAQFELEARGPEGVSERLLREVRRVPGVQTALPVLERQVNVIGPTGEERSVDLVGMEPDSVRASGPLLRRFSATQLATLAAIALPAPLAEEIGAGPLVSVKLQFGARSAETIIGATLDEADIEGLVHDPVALASIEYAQHISGAPGRLTRIFVRGAPAQLDSVHAALERLAAKAGVNLQSGTFDSSLFAVAVAPESESEQLFSGISALVGFMFALNAMLITVPSRRKLIADIRPHGATRAIVVQILLFDAAVIGVLACVLGLALGDVLSVAVFHTTPGYLAFAFPVGDARIVTWQSVALAVAAGMAAAVVGVLWPVREILAAGPLRPEEDVEEHARRSQRARIALGLACVGFTTFTLLADTRAALFGNITLLIALVCLLPSILDGLVRLFDHLSGVLDGVGTALAVTELQAPQTRVRSLAIAATAAVAVFGIVEFQGTQGNLKTGLDASAHALDSSADVWVIPEGRSSLLNTIPFAPIDLGELRRIPGVREVSAYHSSFLNWGKRRLWIVAPGAHEQNIVPASQLVAGSARVASRRLRQRGWALISQALADEQHLGLGQEFVLPSPHPVRLRIIGLTTNLGWPPGAVMLNSAEYERAWKSDEPSAYQIQTDPGTSVDEVRGLVQRALGPDSGLVAETAGERQARHDALAAQGLARITQIRLLVLIAAILAVVGAMAAMLWQRRDRIAFSKCNGFREAVLWRSLLCESAVLLLAGCSIGAVFGLYAQLLGSHFLATVTGFPIAFNVEGVAAVGSFALVTVITVVMLALPGYLVVRVRPSTVNPAY